MYFNLHNLNEKALRQYCNLFRTSNDSSNYFLDTDLGDLQSVYIKFSSKLRSEGFSNLSVSQDYLDFHQDFQDGKVVFCEYIDGCPSELETEYLTQILSFLVSMSGGIIQEQTNSVEGLLKSEDGRKLSNPLLDSYGLKCTVFIAEHLWPFFMAIHDMQIIHIMAT